MPQSSLRFGKSSALLNKSLIMKPLHEACNPIQAIVCVKDDFGTDQPLVKPVHVVILQTSSKLIGQLARLDVAGEFVSRDQDHLQTHTHTKSGSDRTSSKRIQRRCQ